MTDCKSFGEVCKLTDHGDEACDACQYRRAVLRAQRAEHTLSMTQRALVTAGYASDTVAQVPYCVGDLAEERDQWKVESSSAMRALAAWQTWADRLIKKAGKVVPGLGWGDKSARLILGGLLVSKPKRKAVRP